MRTRSSLRPAGLLISFVLFSLFVLQTQAQSALPTLAASASANNALPGTERPASSSASADSSSASNSAASSTPNSSSDAKSTSAASQTTASPTSSSQPSSSNSPPPALTTSKPASSEAPGFLPTGLPKLSGAYSYPAATVPPTANAPYMQKSNMPEGTVFIAVGACLGAIGMAILAWRGYIAWSLHRSVKRAALHQTLTEKAFRPPGATGNAGQFYSAQAGSTLSIDGLSHAKRASTVNAYQKSHTPNGSLFFSPTANAGAPGTASNRGSAYLPSGYYPSGVPAAGDRSSVVLGRGPAAQGYIRHSSGPQNMGPSPPGSPSPSLPPSSHGLPIGMNHHASRSSLNVPPQGRAPSAYLEDLFEGRGARN